MRPVQDLAELENIQQAFRDTMPDYTKVANGSELLEALGDESMKWAAAFCQFTKKRFDIDLELMYVQGWFANAIEHTEDVRRWKREAAAELAKQAAAPSDQNLAPDYSVPL